LLVDDAVHVRRELGELLELSGRVQVVGEAGDGQEAVRLAAGLTPDVILIDLDLPLLDGCEAIRRIKHRAPAVRVVVLTIHTSTADQDRALQAGADAYVVKGASYQALLEAILNVDRPYEIFSKGEKS